MGFLGERLCLADEKEIKSLCLPCFYVFIFDNSEPYVLFSYCYYNKAALC